MERADIISSLKAQIEEISSSGVAYSHTVIEERQTDENAIAVDERISNRQIVDDIDRNPDPEAGAAFKKIIDLVNASDKSEHVIRERLRQKGFKETEIDEAVCRAKQYGFIDDMRFAETLIRSRLAQGKGLAGIERELKSHCIDPFSIDGWPESFNEGDGDELERAIEFLERKPPRSKNVREGAYRKLIQKGYSASIASSASRVWAERSGT